MIEKLIEAKLVGKLRTAIAGATVTGFWQATTTGAIRQEPPLISVKVNPRMLDIPTIPNCRVSVTVDIITTPETDPLKTKLADWTGKAIAYVYTLNTISTAQTDLNDTGYTISGVDILEGDAGFDTDDKIFFVTLPMTVHFTI